MLLLIFFSFSHFYVCVCESMYRYILHVCGNICLGTCVCSRAYRCQESSSTAFPPFPPRLGLSIKPTAHWYPLLTKSGNSLHLPSGAGVTGGMLHPVGICVCSRDPNFDPCVCARSSLPKEPPSIINSWLKFVPWVYGSVQRNNILAYHKYTGLWYL